MPYNEYMKMNMREIVYARRMAGMSMVHSGHLFLGVDGM